MGVVVGVAGEGVSEVLEESGEEGAIDELCEAICDCVGRGAAADSAAAVVTVFVSGEVVD